MQEMAVRAVIPNGELVEIIIMGVRDNGGVFNLLWNATTIGELKGLAERCERIQARKIVANVGQVVTTNRSIVSSTPKVNTVVKTEPAETKTDVRFYNCSQFRHYKGQCQNPYVLMVLFKCGKITHIYRNCPHRKLAQTDATVTFGDVGDIGKGLDAVQMVSVTFNLGGSRHSELIKCVTLLDSDSPKSFVQLSLVPHLQTGCLLDTRCRGNKTDGLWKSELPNSMSIKTFQFI